MSDLEQELKDKINRAFETNDGLFPVLQAALYDPVEILFEHASHLLSCQMGCHACCNRLVVSTRLEAMAVAEQIQKLDEPKRKPLLRKIQEHATQVSDFLENSAEEENHDEVWFEEGIPCPFLEERLCSIYDARPLLCRLRHSVSPVEKCEEPENDIEMLAEVEDLIPVLESGIRLISEKSSPHYRENGFFTIFLDEILNGTGEVESTESSV